MAGLVIARESSATYQKRWKYDRDRGIDRKVPAAAAEDHVAQLLDQGWTLRGIAESAQVSPSVILELKHRRNKGLLVATAGRVMAVRPERILQRDNRDGFVLKIGTVRRVQALLAIGHRHKDITAAMLASNPAVGTSSQQLMHQRGKLITAATRDAVCAAYEQLSMTPGPSPKTRRLAAKYGYVPPLAWDDDTIDDPAATSTIDAEPADQLDEIAVHRIITGTLRMANYARSPERIEAVRRLAAAGWSDTQIADHIGMSRDAVLKTRERNAIAAGVPSGRTA